MGAQAPTTCAAAHTSSASHSLSGERRLRKDPGSERARPRHTAAFRGHRQAGRVQRSVVNCCCRSPGRVHVPPFRSGADLGPCVCSHQMSGVSAPINIPSATCVSILYYVPCTSDHLIHQITHARAFSETPRFANTQQHGNPYHRSSTSINQDQCVAINFRTVVA